MAFEEDFGAFFSLEDFAVEVLWGTATFNGIFDNDTYQVQGENEAEVDVQEPLLRCADEEIVGLKYGDMLTIDGKNYTVKSIRPDGTGTTQLGLTLV